MMCGSDRGPLFLQRDLPLPLPKQNIEREGNKARGRGPSGDVGRGLRTAASSEEAAPMLSSGFHRVLWPPCEGWTACHCCPDSRDDQIWVLCCVGGSQHWGPRPATHPHLGAACEGGAGAQADRAWARPRG